VLFADISIPLPKSYSSAFVESHWYSWWEKEGHFSPTQSKKDGKPSFSMVLPPPNVTGHLHLGHALTSTLEDVLVRRCDVRRDDEDSDKRYCGAHTIIWCREHFRARA